MAIVVGEFDRKGCLDRPAYSYIPIAWRMRRRFKGGI
jgi:hypothetical protein